MPTVMGMPAIAKVAEVPVFLEPWECLAFGMALALAERGTFTWNEWARYLADEITAARARGETDDGSRYYHYWLAALEKIVADKGLVAQNELLTRKDEWDRAARATPHGQPIGLRGPRASAASPP